MENWDTLTLNFKLSILAGTFEISSYILKEDDTLMELLKNKADFDRIYDYISNNY